MAAGSGYINPPLAETGYTDATTPCASTVIIPKRLVYRGVPPLSFLPPSPQITSCLSNLSGEKSSRIGEREGSVRYDFL